MFKLFIITATLSFFSLSNAFACFLAGEQVSGMNKICYYDCVDGTKAITISSVALCPLSILYKNDEKDSKEFFIKEVRNICLKPSDKISCSDAKQKI